MVMMRSVAGFSPVVSESSTTKRTASIGVVVAPRLLEARRGSGSRNGGPRHRRRQPRAIGGELEQPENRSESALEHVAVVAAEQRRRQLRARRALADADPPLLPQHDAQRVGRLAEDPLVLRQQRPRRRRSARASSGPAHRRPPSPKTRPTSTSGRSALCSSRKVEPCSPTLSTTASWKNVSGGRLARQSLASTWRKSRSDVLRSMAAWQSCHNGLPARAPDADRTACARDTISCLHRIAESSRGTGSSTRRARAR